MLGRLCITKRIVLFQTFIFIIFIQNSFATMIFYIIAVINQIKSDFFQRLFSRALKLKGCDEVLLRGTLEKLRGKTNSSDCSNSRNHLLIQEELVFLRSDDSTQCNLFSVDLEQKDFFVTKQRQLQTHDCRQLLVHLQLSNLQNKQTNRGDTIQN